MKRIILTAFAVFVFPLLLSSRVFAYTQDEFDLFKQEYLEYYGGTIGDKYVENILTAWENGGITNNLGKPYLYTYNEAGSYRNSMLCDSATRLSGSLSVVAGDLVASPSFNQANDNTSGALTFNPTRNNYSIPASYNPKFWGSFQDWKDGHVDFENVYYSPAIPLPDINVYFLRPYITPQSGIAYWCSNLVIGPNTDYYVQYGYKVTVPTLVGIGLDSTTGNYTYSYDQYNEGSYIDIVSLEDMKICNGLSFGVNDVANAWQTVYDNVKDIIPEYYPKLAYWVNNPSAPKYLEAQDYYKNYMMTILPMYGNRLEYFARLFTVQDGKVTVGDWVHWSSASGSKTQEKPTNYVDQTELPGTVNTNNNVDLPDEDNTYNSVGTSVGNQPTIINNNYVPNYPDYPTVVTYNHDNILLNSMDLAKQLPSYFGDFGSFLTSAFIFIPKWIWILIGTGFAFSIVVMIIKVL